MSSLAPIVLALYVYNICTANIIGAALCSRLLGEAGRIRCANNKILRIFHGRCTSPISGVRIAAPIEFAQHKGYKRIGKA